MSSSESETEEELRQRLADQIHGTKVRERDKVKDQGIGKSSLRSKRRAESPFLELGPRKRKRYEPEDIDPGEGPSSQRVQESERLQQKPSGHNDKENEPTIGPHSEPYVEYKEIQGDGFKIRIYRKKFQRYHSWHSLDSLFGFYFKPNDVQKPPRMLGSMQGLSDSLFDSIEQVKKAFAKHEDRLVYLCIEHSKINNGLNLGCRRLNRPTHELVQGLLDLLYNYLNSNEGMELNSDFHISAKVISKEHEAHLAQKSGWQPDQYDAEVAPPIGEVSTRV